MKTTSTVAAWHIALSLAACCSLTFWTGTVLAQQPTSRTSAPPQPGTITVNGTGTATATPTYALLRGRIEAGGASGEEAIKQYRELRNEVEKKLGMLDKPRAKLRLAGEKLTSESTPDSDIIAVPAAGPVPPPAPGPIPAAGGGDGPFMVQEMVELRIDFTTDMERLQAAETIGELIDLATDAGVTFRSPQSDVYYVGIETPAIVLYCAGAAAAAQDKADAAALEDARKRAASLAKLSGVKLGKVVTIEEVDPELSQNALVAAIVTLDVPPTDRAKLPLSSERNEPIVVQRNLRVVFQLLED